MGFKHSVMAAGLLMGVLTAPAQAGDWYITGFGGAQFMDEIDVFHSDRVNASAISFCFPGPCNFPDRDVAKNTVMDFDAGFTGGLVVGKQISPIFRAELELAFAHNDIDGATTGWQVGFESAARTSSPVIIGTSGIGIEYGVDGNIDAYTILANGWYDLPTGTSVRPYAGGGVGIGLVDLNATWGSFPERSTPPNEPAVNGYHFTDVGFAYQVGAGVRVPVSESLLIDVGYRYRGIEGIKFKPDIAALPTAKPHLGSHVVQVGLSWQLP